MRQHFFLLVILAMGSFSPCVYADTLKTWDDGTAYVKGTVIKHTTGCEIDGACSLIVNVNDQYIALVYAEGEMACKNTQVSGWVQWGESVKAGDVLQAYGAYQRNGEVQSMRFCDSKEYFLLDQSEPLPKKFTKRILDAR